MPHSAAERTELPLVSVIVPAYNAEATIGRCLASLRCQTYPANKVEIIVVDDGSEDATCHIAEKYSVRLIRQNHENQATARNRGAKYAHGDIYMFTDSDCEPAPDWVERMAAPFADPNVTAVKGRYRTKQQGILPRFIQQEFEVKYSRLQRARQLDFVDGYAAAYRRDHFVKLGGFDARYPPVEDIELSFRAAQSGYKLVFATDAVVYHRHRDTLLGYIRTKARAASLWVAVYKAHPSKIGSDARQPRSVVFQIGLAAALGVGGLLSLLVPRLRPWVVAGTGIFFASTFKFAAWVFASDREVGIAAPFLIFLRSLSQAAGIVHGAANRLITSAADRPRRLDDLQGNGNGAPR